MKKNGNGRKKQVMRQRRASGRQKKSVVIWNQNASAFSLSILKLNRQLLFCSFQNRKFLVWKDSFPCCKFQPRKTLCFISFVVSLMRFLCRFWKKRNKLLFFESKISSAKGSHAGFLGKLTTDFELWVLPFALWFGNITVLRVTKVLTFLCAFKKWILLSRPYERKDCSQVTTRTFPS